MMPCDRYPIPGFDGYAVDKSGNVWSSIRMGNTRRADKPWRLLKPMVHNTYKNVHLRWPDGKRRKTTIHSLVLLAFSGPKPLGYVARHLDGDPLNNSPGNLEWGTEKDNQGDSVRHGTKSRGETVSKISTEDVIRIRQMRKDGHTLQVIADIFNISYQHVSSIMHKKAWAWLPD